MPETPEERRARKAANARASYHRHRTTMMARGQTYREAHREELRAKARQYKVTHATEFQASQEAYRAANKEKIRLKNARYRAANRERELARSRAYRTIHRDRLNAQKRAQPEQILEKAKRRRALKKGAPINDLTLAQWREIKAAYDYRCVYCHRKLATLTMDHITPLNKGGSHTAPNVVPACLSCNASKRDGPPPVPVQPLLLTIAPRKKPR